jgi:hypothetical protein
MTGPTGEAHWDADRQRWVRGGPPQGTPAEDGEPSSPLTGPAAWVAPPVPPRPPEAPPLPPEYSSRVGGPGEERAAYAPSGLVPGEPLRYDGYPTVPSGAQEPGRRRARVLSAAVAVVVCCALVAGGWLLLRGPGGHPAKQVRAGASTAHTGGTGGSGGGGSGPEPSTEAATSSGPATGYTMTQDPLGFTLDIPQGWTRQAQLTSDGGQVFFTPDGETHLVQVGVVLDPTDTPYDTFQTMEKELAAERNGFQLHRLDRLDGDPDGPVEIEFSYDSPQTGPRHVIDRGFIGPNGTFYAILVAGPEDDWAGSLAMYHTVTGSFCATDYCAQATDPGTAAGTPGATPQAGAFAPGGGDTG